MSIFGKTDSEVINEKQIPIKCENCRTKDNLSLQFFISYYFLFSFPLFPEKKHIISHCEHCGETKYQEDFSNELNENIKDFDTRIPWKYYIASLLLVGLSQFFIAYNAKSELTTIILMSFVGFAFFFAFFYGFRQLGKNPYLALLNFIPFIGFLAIIILLFYYWANSSSPNIALLSEENLDSKSIDKPVEANSNYAPPQPHPESLFDVAERDSDDTPLQVKENEFDFLIETIIRNQVWYVRHNNLNPKDYDWKTNLYKDYELEFGDKMKLWKDEAINESIESLTKMVVRSNELLIKTYPPKIKVFLLQYVAPLQKQSYWTFSHFTQSTDLLLDSIGIPENERIDYWSLFLDKRGLKEKSKNIDSVNGNESITQKSTPEAKSYFFFKNILLTMIWYLRMNNLKIEDFDFSMIQSSFNKLSKDCMEQEFEELYKMYNEEKLEKLTDTVIHQTETVYKSMKRKTIAMTYSFIVNLHQQSAWKLAYYTDITDRFLAFHYIPSLQRKSFWQDTLSLSVKQPNNSSDKLVELEKHSLSMKNDLKDLSENEIIFFVEAVMLNIIWYIREHGFSILQFNLLENFEVYKKYNPLIEKQYTNAVAMEIHILEAKVIKVNKEIISLFTLTDVYFLLHCIASIQSQKAWINEEFTDITDDLLGFFQINLERRRSLWKDLIENKVSYTIPNIE